MRTRYFVLAIMVLILFGAFSTGIHADSANCCDKQYDYDSCPNWISNDDKCSNYTTYNSEGKKVVCQFDEYHDLEPPLPPEYEPGKSCQKSQKLCYRDCDDDGYKSSSYAENIPNDEKDCKDWDPSEYVPYPYSDCEDVNCDEKPKCPQCVNPGENEDCDGVDNDCDGLVYRNGERTDEVCYGYYGGDGVCVDIDEKFDKDGDRWTDCGEKGTYYGPFKQYGDYGDPNESLRDCDDKNQSIHPLAGEKCNGVDDNCGVGRCHDLDSEDFGKYCGNEVLAKHYYYYNNGFSEDCDCVKKDENTFDWDKDKSKCDDCRNNPVENPETYTVTGYKKCNLTAVINETYMNPDYNLQEEYYSLHNFIERMNVLQLSYYENKEWKIELRGNIVSHMQNEVDCSEKICNEKADNPGEPCNTNDDCENGFCEKKYSKCAKCINPGADEICDGADNDCDGEVDEGFEDSDGDGWKKSENFDRSTKCGDCDDDTSDDPDKCSNLVCCEINGQFGTDYIWKESDKCLNVISDESLCSEMVTKTGYMCNENGHYYSDCAVCFNPGNNNMRVKAMTTGFRESFKEKTENKRGFSPSKPFTPFDNIFVEIKADKCVSKPNSIRGGYLKSEENPEILAGPGFFEWDRTNDGYEFYRWSLDGWDYSNEPIGDPIPNSGFFDSESKIQHLAHLNSQMVLGVLDINGHISEEVSIPFKMCMSLWEGENKEHKIVTMKTKSSGKDSAWTIQRAMDDMINGFWKIDPFAYYKDKFSFSIDLKEHDDSTFQRSDVVLMQLPSKSVCSGGKPYVMYSDADVRDGNGYAQFGNVLIDVQPVAGRVTGALTTMHEVGHAFCGLWDEYDARKPISKPGKRNCFRGVFDDMPFLEEYGSLHKVCSNRDAVRTTSDSLMRGGDSSMEHPRLNTWSAAICRNKILGLQSPAIGLDDSSIRDINDYYNSLRDSAQFVLDAGMDVVHEPFGGELPECIIKDNCPDASEESSIDNRYVKKCANTYNDNLADNECVYAECFDPIGRDCPHASKYGVSSIYYQKDCQNVFSDENPENNKCVYSRCDGEDDCPSPSQAGKPSEYKVKCKDKDESDRIGKDCIYAECFNDDDCPDDDGFLGIIGGSNAKKCDNTDNNNPADNECIYAECFTTLDCPDPEEEGYPTSHTKICHTTRYNNVVIDRECLYAECFGEWDCPEGENCLNSDDDDPSNNECA